jgi:hypothetical protein
MNKNVYFPDPADNGRDEHAEIKAAADTVGESLSEFMRKASFERIERENIVPKRRGRRGRASASAATA